MSGLSIAIAKVLLPGLSISNKCIAYILLNYVVQFSSARNSQLINHYHQFFLKKYLQTIIKNFLPDNQIFYFQPQYNLLRIIMYRQSADQSNLKNILVSDFMVSLAVRKCVFNSFKAAMTSSLCVLFMRVQTGELWSQEIHWTGLVKLWSHKKLNIRLLLGSFMYRKPGLFCHPRAILPPPLEIDKILGYSRLLWGFIVPIFIVIPWPCHVDVFLWLSQNISVNIICVIIYRWDISYVL